MLFTGKSFELMGMAAFNMFLAMILSVTFMSQSGNSSLNRLTEENISQFIKESTAISSGTREGMDQLGIAEYLMKHIQDGSIFKSTVQIDIENAAEKERDLAFDKKNYIGHVLEGLKAMKDHEESTRIENIQIADGATHAKVITSSVERGSLQVDAGTGEPVMTPVRGISYCEQNIILKDRTIRMAGAVCSTSIQSDGSQ